MVISHWFSLVNSSKFDVYVSSYVTVFMVPRYTPTVGRYHPKTAVPKTALSQSGRVSTNRGICWYGMVLIIGLRTAVLGHGRFGIGHSGT